MLCENCGKDEANVTYTENINGKIKKLYLCSECGEKVGIGNFGFSTDFNSLLSNFLTHASNDELEYFSKEKLKCKKCGYTYDDFTKVGKFGCSHCYETFSEQLEDILKRVHGSNRHVGKQLVQSKNTGDISKESNKPNIKKKTDKIQDLQKKLKQAIGEENYEEAARIRDEIRGLE